MSPRRPGARPGPMAAGAWRRRAAWAVLLCLGCVAGETRQAPKGPPRPVGVPEAAFWSGGSDGGAFIVLERRPQDPQHIYRARVFHDGSGTLWYEGRLALEPSDGPTIDPGKTELFGGWDGESLYLRAGGALKAIDPMPVEGRPEP